jgi:hypothetical protein
MANTYAWTINNLDVYPTENDLTNVVYNIHWTYTATSDQLDPEENPYKTNFIGTSMVAAPSAEDFTPFEDLTESQVVGWLSEDASIINIQENVDDALDNLINPTSVTKDVPW